MTSDVASTWSKVDSGMEVKFGGVGNNLYIYTLQCLSKVKMTLLMASKCFCFGGTSESNATARDIKVLIDNHHINY